MKTCAIINPKGLIIMGNILEYLNLVTDTRQEKKVLHKMGDIIALVFFALLSNADEWTAIEVFGKEHEEFLRKYLELPHGIPSHDTIERVFSMVSPEFLQKFRMQWDEMLNSGEGEKIKRILSIDGKTQRGNPVFYQQFADRRERNCSSH